MAALWIFSVLSTLLCLQAALIQDRRHLPQPMKYAFMFDQSKNKNFLYPLYPNKFKPFHAGDPQYAKLLRNFKAVLEMFESTTCLRFQVSFLLNIFLDFFLSPIFRGGLSLPPSWRDIILDGRSQRGRPPPENRESLNTDGGGP